ncbi:MAG: response regulator [Ferrovum sp.]|jgi:DNA-binding NarL/FixJ family response regulator|nr:response regulator [Ferrovum sp.]NDU90277.1 response regulator transcription factor [Ferrovum sp.]
MVTAIVVLSSQDDSDTCQEALDKGADKFVSKSETGQRMVALVQKLLHITSGGPTVPTKAMGFLAGTTQKKTKVAVTIF